jgi:HSP20 family protein
MPMDAYCHDGTLVMHFDLLGADPETVAVALDGDLLTVMADWAVEDEGDEGDEATPGGRREGTFWQRLSLGVHLDCEHVRARYTDGVVTITLPVVAGSAVSVSP